MYNNCNNVHDKLMNISSQVVIIMNWIGIVFTKIFNINLLKLLNKN